LLLEFLLLLRKGGLLLCQQLPLLLDVVAGGWQARLGLADRPLVILLGLLRELREERLLGLRQEIQRGTGLGELFALQR